MRDPLSWELTRIALEKMNAERIENVCMKLKLDKYRKTKLCDIENGSVQFRVHFPFLCLQLTVARRIKANFVLAATVHTTP